jgi:2-hydroxychromene-2-carboxylate isomerase
MASSDKKFEFFYDISSPWTYLAFTRVEDVAMSKTCAIGPSFATLR